MGSSRYLAIRYEIPPPLGDFLCIPTSNTGQLNPLFHTFAEFRLIVKHGSPLIGWRPMHNFLLMPLAVGSIPENTESTIASS